MDGLSLACNIIQLADGAHKAFVAVKALKDNGGPDGGLATHCNSLQKLSYELRQSIDARGPTQSLSPADVALDNHAKKLAGAATELQTELGKFKGTKKGRIKDTIRYMRKRHAIRELGKMLGQLQSDMDSHILVDIRQRMRDNHEDIRSEWNNLRADLRDFILTQLNASDKALAVELGKQSAATRSTIIEESSRVKEAVVSESVTIRETVSLGFSSMRIGGLAAEVQAFVDSFRFPEMNSRRNASSLEHADGSFEWVFYPKANRDMGPYVPWPQAEAEAEAGKFIQWLQGDQELFWVSGKPGSGKSTLMNFLVRDPRTLETLNASHPGSRAFIVDAFIWKPGVILQKSARGVLCTLIHGILSEDVSVAEWLHSSTPQASRKKGPSDWSRRELEYALQQSIERAGRPACIFIDGLDEVDGKDTTDHSMLDLVHFIRRIPFVKLCVASRPEPVFNRLLQHYPHLRLHDLTAGDIRNLIKTSLRSGHSLTYNEMSGLVDQVTWLADGVFLWVRLVTNSLLTGIVNGDDWKTLTGRIDDMPNDLTEMYRGMWNRLGNDAQRYREQAGLFFDVLIWSQSVPNLSLSHSPFMDMVMVAEPDMRQAVLYGMLGTGRPRTDELRIICDKTQERIRTACAGLLEVERGRNSNDGLGGHTYTHVDFIHRSALDFLQGEGQDILDQGRITRQTLLECLLASDLVLTTPIVNPFSIPFCDFDTPSLWMQALMAVESYEIHYESECISILRKTLDCLPAWREENRSFFELLVMESSAKQLPLADSPSIWAEGHAKISRRRLLLATLTENERERYYSSKVSWVLQNFPIDAPWGFDMDDPVPAIRLIEKFLDFEDKPDEIVRRFLMDSVSLNPRCALFASIADTRTSEASEPRPVLTHFEIDRHNTMDRMDVVAIIETSVGFFSRMTFHNWQVEHNNKKLRDDPELTHVLVNTISTHVNIVGLIGRTISGGHISRVAKKVRQVLPLDQDDIRTDGLPGSSDVESFMQQLSPSALRDLWDESEAEEMDPRATVEWLVQERYMSPGALTLADPLDALKYGEFLM